VLALERLETPARFTKLSCDGRVFDLTFVAMQPAGPKTLAARPRARSTRSLVRASSSPQARSPTT